MRPQIPAIQTRYKGFCFRSRLEARYAVFFDALGVRWEYEKEGYVLNSAGLYLPDFWLTDFKTWVEIKGELPSTHWTETEAEIKMRQLVTDTNASAGFIFFGLPSEDVLSYYISIDHSVFPTPEVIAYRSVGMETDSDFTVGKNHNDLQDAFDAAKSARFEFGAEGRQ